jgi:hypothetical protein
LLTTVEKCNYIHLLNTFNNLNFNNKLKHGFISIQKSVLQIYKNSKQKDLYDEASSGGVGGGDAFIADKPLIQMNIENCIVYRGFISSSKVVSSSSSSSNRKSIGGNQSNEILDTDNCITIYHLLDQQLYLISFLNQLDCIKWYYNLFKSRYYPDTYSLYKSDTFPNVKPNVPMQSRNSLIITNTASSSSDTNGKKIFDIFKKK